MAGAYRRGTLIDLHTHSSVSDGSDLPERIPELAAAAGCSAVALTDHDRLDGLPAAAARAAEVGVRLVPGCEISCRWDRGNLHVLVYFVEPGEGPFQDALVELQQAREERNRAMALALGLDYEEMLELAEAGLAGVEAIYGRYHRAEREGLATMARRLGLVAAGGSDHHGTYKPDLAVGVGRGDLAVPDSALDELENRRPASA